MKRIQATPLLVLAYLGLQATPVWADVPPQDTDEEGSEDDGGDESSDDDGGDADSEDDDDSDTAEDDDGGCSTVAAASSLGALGLGTAMLFGIRRREE
jgi:hypothetical protein